MRVIIRFSIDNEKDGALRNKLATKLRAAKFGLLKHTATWSNTTISEHRLALTLSAFWRTADGHSGPGRLDHFWLYSDRWARGPYKKKTAGRLTVRA